ncbi:MAG: glycosyltransferase family 39 protein [Anaerolineae bacterium]|nr:glycosyltransferase family 39 protein [Anaerolineae bacterium]
MIFTTLALHQARRWHPDEAFYMTIARNAAIHGDWMLVSEPLDKPPFSYYSNALALVFLGIKSDENGVLFLDVYQGEFAGRIPSLLMSVLLVAVIIAIAKSVWRDDWRSAAIAGVFAALSPLRIVFAATAFTDIPMLLFATLALWMALRGKWGWSGIWFMMSLAAKPQSIFYAPVLIGIGILQMRQSRNCKQD